MHASKVVTTGQCEAITIRTADGKSYYLGRPNSWLFSLRLKWYVWRRRKEFPKT